MGSSYDPESVSAVISLSTQAPFPRLRVADISDSNLQPPTYDPSDDKVELQVCSEFTNYTAAVSAFESTAKLALFTDGNGQPVLCSIGDDKRLYLLYHVDGGSGAWQLTDITPGSAKDRVQAFDMVSWDQKVFFAVATQLSNGASVVSTCSIDLPKFTAAGTPTLITPNLAEILRWRQLPNNLGDKAITYLRCAPAAPPLVTTAVYQIVAGTENFGPSAASEYVIDPSDASLSPWTYLPLPETTWKVLQIEGASTGSGVGTFTLYQNPDGIGCTQSVIDSSGKWVQPLANIRLLTGVLGNVNGMGVNTNPALQTDLFLAGDKGIGFYQANRLTKPPQIILPEVSFKQVSAHEDLDPGSPSTQSNLTIFGVSTTGELYFISGTRKFARNQIDFEFSGLPIRTNVARLSCFFNGVLGSNEIIYAVDNDNKIKHLRRDINGDSWTESTICVPSTGKLRTFPAYVSSITCTNGNGNTVYEGYPLNFTCDAVSVLANNKTYNLSATTTVIPADSSGKVKLVIETDETLAAPTITVGLTKFLTTVNSHPIYPHQRVLSALATVQHGDDLRAARTAKGALVLADQSSSDIQRSKQDACGDLLSNFKSMVNGADPDAAHQILNTSDADHGDFALVVEKDESGKFSVSSDTSWVDKVFSTVKKFVSDVMEWIKSQAKKVFRIAFRVVAGVLEFVMQVAGRIIKVALKTVGHLLKSLVGFLKEHLGIDLTGLMTWLGFILDVDEIKKTQQVLLNVTHGGLGLTERFLDVNRSTLKDAIGALRTVLKDKGIKDMRPSKPNLNATKGSKIFEVLMHNPLIHGLQELNPLTAFFDIIKEAAEEELAEMIKLPNMDNMGAIVTEIIPDLLKDELETLLRLVRDVYEKVKAVLSDPSHAGEIIVSMVMGIFWTIFDASEAFIMAVYDILVRLLKQLFVTMTSTIKIPVLTTFFEIFAEQEFSIINCITFIIAGIMNIVYSVQYGKRPFEVLGDPSGFFDSIDDSLLDLHGILHLQPALMAPEKPVAVRSMAIKRHTLAPTDGNARRLNSMPATTSGSPDVALFLKPNGINMNGSVHLMAATDTATDDDYKRKDVVPCWGGTAAVVSALAKAISGDVISKLLIEAGGGEKEGVKKTIKKPVKNSDGSTAKNADGTDKTFDQLTIIATVPFFVGNIVGFAGSIIELATYSTAMGKSSRYADELGYRDERSAAYGINILFAVLGIGVAAVNLGVKRSEVQNLGASLPLMGDMVYQGLLNIACPGDQNTKAAAGIRIGLVDGLGIVGNGLTSVPVPIVKAVGYGCNATSMICAGIATSMVKLKPSIT